MKSRLDKLLMGIFACLVIMLMFNVNAHADSATVSVSSANGAVGDTVTVSVKVTPDVDAMAQIAISYDTNYLEYISTNGSDGVAGLVKDIIDEVKAGATGEVNFNFKLRAAGSTNVSVAAVTQIYNIKSGDEPISYTSTNGTITIGGTAAASGNSHLDGMLVQAVDQNGNSSAVSYAPNFSPEVFEYRADLPSGTTKLVVSTTLSDASSTTKVSGTKIDPGDNKTTITVTAADGTQSQYILYTTRGTASTEPTSEVGSEVPTTTFDRSPKHVKSIGMYIIQDFSLVYIPEGFEESTAAYNGETIAVLKGIAKELTLICLATDAQGSNAGLYLYNEASGAIDKMINISTSQKMYTVIPTDDTYVGPEGYTPTTIEIDGQNIKAWVKSADSQFYVVYAMNWDGEKSLYIYDAKEQTMQRFIEGTKSENVEDIPEEENKEYLSMKKKYDDMYSEYVADHSKKNKIIIGFGILTICLMIVIVMMYYKTRANKINDDEVEDEDFEEIGEDDSQNKELKLDMVAQVNEVKAEKLAKQVSEILDAAQKVDDENSADENTPEESNINESSAEEANIEEANIEEANVEELDSEESNIEDINIENANMNSEHTENNKNVDADYEAGKDTKEDSESTNKMNDASKKEKNISDNGVLINPEDDEPFEIEFVDLNDGNDKSR